MSISTNPATAELSEIIGDGLATAGPELADYAIGPFVPSAVVRPVAVEQVAAIISWAHRRGVAVYPAGGRTLSQLGNVPDRAGIALDLTGLNRMLDFQSADLTVQVEAGITVAQLDARLAQDGRHVPLGAPRADRGTVGGTLATGISGPMRAAYGLPRDWLIGVSVVGADGTASKAGGQVVKNVTGYDLNRLYTGSLGTLGVIVEATFKIAPRPTEWAAVAAAFADDRTAVAASRLLLDQPVAPQALHVLNPAAARRLGDADLPTGYGPVAVAISCGRPASVQRRAQDTAAAWLDAASALHIRGNEAARLADAIGDLPFHPENGPSVCVRINAPPGRLAELLTLGRADWFGGEPAVVADAGFGGGRVLSWSDDAGRDVDGTVDGIRRLQALAAEWGGDAIVELCPPEVKARIDVWGPAPSGMAIMRRIKAQYDPGNILNPGRFIGGL